MKKIITVLALSLSFTSNAQFVVGVQGMTIQNGATLTIDSLVIQPTTDLSIASNQLQRSPTNVPVNSGTSINRVYAFTNPLNFTGTLGFYYRDAEMAGNTETGLKVNYATSNAGNVWLTTTGSVVSASTNYISQSFSSTIVSRITASSASVPLPVTLIDFTAEKKEPARVAVLRWEVANEFNLHQYNVQRSIDGNSFHIIGSVKATGNKTYTINDQHPEDGINYYRLEMIDNDGTSNYSAVRQLLFGTSVTTVSVYPNPVISEVTLHTNDNSLTNTAGTVINASGIVVAQFVLAGNHTTIPASSWAPGNYLIKLNSGHVFKVLKQ